MHSQSKLSRLLLPWSLLVLADSEHHPQDDLSGNNLSGVASETTIWVPCLDLLASTHDRAHAAKFFNPRATTKKKITVLPCVVPYLR